jgi:hypothetical protein
MVSSSSSVKRSRPGRSRGIDRKRGLEDAAIARASALRSVGEGLVSMKRGLVRAAISRANVLRSLISDYFNIPGVRHKGRKRRPA